MVMPSALSAASSTGDGSARVQFQFDTIAGGRGYGPRRLQRR